MAECERSRPTGAGIASRATAKQPNDRNDTEAPSTAPTASGPAVATWAGLIRPHLDRAAESLVAAGAGLIDAKAALPHGQFGALLVELNMTPRTAQRFMAIAKNVVLRDATRVSHLPSAWSTLYELSRLPDEVLATAIDSGEVNPETTRAEAVALQGMLSPEEEARFAALEASIACSVDALRSDLGGIAGSGVVRLRVLDKLLRGMPAADKGDATIRVALLGIAIDVLDGLPVTNEGGDPVGRLSASIAWVLPHLWRGDHEATVRALAVLTVDAANLPVEVRSDFLLQVLDGRTAEEVHPSTRLIVDALLAGFAVDKVPA